MSGQDTRPDDLYNLDPSEAKILQSWMIRHWLCTVMIWWINSISMTSYVRLSHQSPSACPGELTARHSSVLVLGNIFVSWSSGARDTPCDQQDRGQYNMLVLSCFTLSHSMLGEVGRSGGRIPSIILLMLWRIEEEKLDMTPGCGSQNMSVFSFNFLENWP